MGRKTSLYERKRRGKPSGATADDAKPPSWLNVLNDSSSYQDGVLASLGLTADRSTIEAAEHVLRTLRGALVALASGATPWQDAGVYEVVVDSMAIGVVRSIEIAGEAVAGNPLLQIFRDAESALRECAARRSRTFVWNLTGEERAAVELAIEQYQEVFSMSSPRQMQAAFLRHVRHLDQRVPGQGSARIGKLLG